MTPQLPANGLYAITPSTKDTPALLRHVELALSAGIAVLQYRDKTNSSEQQITIAKTLQSLCQRYHTTFIINDNPQLAQSCKADGVHLGQSDGSVAQARKLLGDDAVIGVTCHHDLSLALTAQRQGANYVAFGRFFESNTKPGAALATTELIQQASAQLDIPIVCIGGITQQNAAPLIAAGANYLAVIEGLFAADDIAPASHAFTRLFNQPIK